MIGSACGIIATLDPARIEYRQTMDELNLFCHEQSLPNELTVKLRGYFRNTIHMIRSKRYEQLLSRMSTRLRGDTAFRMCEYRLRAVPFLVHPDLEPEFMCHLAIKYKTNVYSRLERVPCIDLFIVERGVVAKRGRLGLSGTCFGKDVMCAYQTQLTPRPWCLRDFTNVPSPTMSSRLPGRACSLSNENLRDVGDAIALTFVQTLSLTQSDIFELLPDFPQAYHIVRKAALRMALIRSLVKAAQLVKRSKSIQKGRSIIDIFDQVHALLTWHLVAAPAPELSRLQSLSAGAARGDRSSRSETVRGTAEERRIRTTDADSECGFYEAEEAQYRNEGE